MLKNNPEAKLKLQLLQIYALKYNIPKQILPTNFDYIYKHFYIFVRQPNKLLLEFLKFYDKNIFLREFFHHLYKTL